MSPEPSNNEQLGAMESHVRAGGWRLMRDVAISSKRSLVVGISASLLWTIAKIAIPLFALKAVDEGIDPYDASTLAFWAGGIVVLTLVTGGATYVRRTSAFEISLRAEAELRRRLFDHLQRLHFAYHDRAQIGELMARASTDSKQVQMLLVFIPIAGANFVMVTGVTAVLLVLDAKLAVVALASLPLLFFFAVRLSSKLHPVAMGLQERLAGVSHVVEESLSGVRVVKGFGAEDLRTSQLAGAADKVYERGMALARLRATYNPLLEVLPTLGLVGILYVGGREVINGNLSVAALITFNFYILQLIFPLRMTSFMVAQISRASASASRLYEVLATNPEIVQRKDAEPLPPGKGDLRFANVTFGYRMTAPVLHGFDLDIAAGESVALVGSTGSGKSTVARLVPRFYDVHAGTVELDGVDVREWNKQELRRHVGLVLQDVFLFSGDIAHNITLGDGRIGEARMLTAARRAHIAPFIEKLPNRYQQEVQERGSTLSQGQRQLLSFARALAFDPQILILDEATSSVDTQTEILIQEALEELLKNRTALIIAHRLSTIQHADRILVIHKGEIWEQGSHDDLLAQGGLYARLYDLQYGFQEHNRGIADGAPTATET